MTENGSDREKEPVIPAEEPGESYLGSVRFFKHLILTIVALLIVVPSVSLAVVSVKYRRLKREEHVVQAEYKEDVVYAERKDTAVLPAEQELAAETEDTDETKEAQAAEKDTEHTLQIPFAVDLNDWNYILVNEKNWLPEDFSVKLVRTRNGQKVDRRIKEPLEQMLDAAAAAGHPLLISSSYRSIERQSELVEDSIRERVAAGESYKKAFWDTKWSQALAGTSEHHTGLAVDIVGTGYQALDAEQADQPEAKWLREHACEYGFILRYPEGKEDITGKKFESWHFRYVGKEAAAFIKENGLCLEEFTALAQSRTQNME